MSDHPRRQPQSAFDDLARLTLADHSLESVMTKIAELVKDTVSGVDEASVTLVEDGRAKTVAFTGRLAMSLDERQYERGYGPCLDSIVGGEPVHIGSMRGDARWPDFTAHAVREGVGSSLSIPVPVQREVFAAINAYSTREQGFDESAVELTTTFAAYAGVALANMHLYEAQAKVAEQLQTAMQSRAVIEQAKGVLMAERRCTAEDAFNLLVDLSQRSNRKLKDVAQALVARASGQEGG